MKSLRLAAIEISGFFRTHWFHLVLAIPGVLAVTVLHELAHGAAVVCQGGVVTQFVWLPSSGKWGHIAYTFRPTQQYSGPLISIAPYVLWSACMCAALVLCLRRTPYPHWVASSIFVWLFIVPLADITSAGMGFALGATNDLWRAFGPCSAPAVLALALFATSAAVAGFWLQKRLYREMPLHPLTYTFLGIVAILGILCLA